MKQFFGGVLVGVGIGMLIAPMKGEDLRHLLNERVRTTLPTGQQLSSSYLEVQSRGIDQPVPRNTSKPDELDTAVPNQSTLKETPAHEQVPPTATVDTLETSSPSSNTPLETVSEPTSTSDTPTVQVPDKIEPAPAPVSDAPTVLSFANTTPGTSAMVEKLSTPTTEKRASTPITETNPPKQQTKQPSQDEQLYVKEDEQEVTQKLQRPDKKINQEAAETLKRRATKSSGTQPRTGTRRKRSH